MSLANLQDTKSIKINSIFIPATNHEKLKNFNAIHSIKKYEIPTNISDKRCTRSVWSARCARSLNTTKYCWEKSKNGERYHGLLDVLKMSFLTELICWFQWRQSTSQQVVFVFVLMWILTSLFCNSYGNAKDLEQPK